MNIPKPPVAPLPPHYSPPAERPPSGLPPLPHPPPGFPPAAATHGTGYETATGKKHKIIYRVGTSSGSHTLPAGETIEQAIAAAEAYLRDHAAQTGKSTSSSPTAGTVTITASPAPGVVE